MDVDDFLFDVEEMLGDPRYKFAEEYLRGVSKTVTSTRVVTDAQLRAVQNIRRSKEEIDSRGPNWTRRYEGHGSSAWKKKETDE